MKIGKLFVNFGMDKPISSITQFHYRFKNNVFKISLKSYKTKIKKRVIKLVSPFKIRMKID